MDSRARGGGGAAGLDPCVNPPPQVLRDSGVGAMAPTVPKFFCACFPFTKPFML